MVSSCRQMYRSWQSRPLLEGEELQPPPPLLAQMLHKAHACILKTRNAGVSDARVFDEMTEAEKMLALEEALREMREHGQAEQEDCELDLDDELN